MSKPQEVRHVWCIDNVGVWHECVGVWHMRQHVHTHRQQQHLQTRATSRRDLGSFGGGSQTRRTHTRVAAGHVLDEAESECWRRVPVW
jgi:hypothetical protein